uniref:Secreted protein n=1 Tax=Mesocestoides corti TaxID=53468 RepID=A0A5K3EGJ5_MESCO
MGKHLLPQIQLCSLVSRDAPLSAFGRRWASVHAVGSCSTRCNARVRTHTHALTPAANTGYPGPPPQVLLLLQCVAEAYGERRLTTLQQYQRLPMHMRQIKETACATHDHETS